MIQNCFKRQRETKIMQLGQMPIISWYEEQLYSSYVKKILKLSSYDKTLKLKTSITKTIKTPTVL